MGMQSAQPHPPHGQQNADCLRMAELNWVEWKSWAADENNNYWRGHLSPEDRGCRAVLLHGATARRTPQGTWSVDFQPGSLIPYTALNSVRKTKMEPEERIFLFITCGASGSMSVPSGVYVEAPASGANGDCKQTPSKIFFASRVS